LSVRIARDVRNPLICIGYGYIDFACYNDASLAMSRYNGVKMVSQSHRLNLSLIGDGSQGFSFNTAQVYVANTGIDVDDGQLYTAFKLRFASVTSAKVARLSDGISLGYGFVAFHTNVEAYDCVTILQKTPLKIGNLSLEVRETYRRSRLEIERGIDDVTNSTVFVGNLHQTVTEELLMISFSVFGPIESARVVYQRGFGFVIFVHNFSALAALSHMQSVEINGQSVHCMWGRIRPFGVEELVDDEYQTSAEKFNQEWTSSLIPEKGEKYKANTTIEKIPCLSSLLVQDSAIAELPRKLKPDKYLNGVVSCWRQCQS